MTQSLGTFHVEEQNLLGVRLLALIQFRSSESLSSKGLRTGVLKGRLEAAEFVTFSLFGLSQQLFDMFSWSGVFGNLMLQRTSSMVGDCGMFTISRV